MEEEGTSHDRRAARQSFLVAGTQEHTVDSIAKDVRRMSRKPPNLMVIMALPLLALLAVACAGARQESATGSAESEAGRRGEVEVPSACP